MKARRLSDLTIDELWELLRDKAEALILEKLGHQPEGSDQLHSDLSDFPVDSYGTWPDDLPEHREDLYGDDQR